MCRIQLPKAAIIDAQSMVPSRNRPRSVGMPATRTSRGANGICWWIGLGLPLSVCVTPADVQDRAGARCLLAGLKPLVPPFKEDLGRWSLQW